MPGQLPQPTEVLEVGGEGAEPAGLQELPQPEFDPRGVPQRLPLRRHRAAATRTTAYCVVVVGGQRVDLRVAHLVDHRDQIVDPVGVHRDAETPLRLDLVALGDGDVAHVVAEPGHSQRCGSWPHRGPPGPRRRWPPASRDG